MLTLFEYIDYRKYLADYFKERKASDSSFSYRSFADSIGFKAKDFVYRVINGAKNLSEESAGKISAAIGHGKREAEYFKSLVAFNQAKTNDERDSWHERMDAIVKQVRYRGSAELILHDRYELFSEWHHLVVRSLIEMFGFKGDFEWLGRQVRPEITAAQAKKSVALLEKLGLVTKDESGAYSATNKMITTGEQVERNALNSFYLTCLENAKQALDAVPRDKRNVSGLTLGISQKTYNLIVEKIQAIRKEIADIANADDEADRVYQMNFLFFPASNIDPKEGEQA